MHQNDAFFGVFQPAGIVKEYRLHFATRGNKFSFNMADLTQFFREIQRAEYFDSILVRLPIEDLENDNDNAILGSNEGNSNRREI